MAALRAHTHTHCRCSLIEQDPNSTVGLWKPVAGGPVPCPKQGEPHSADAVVHGGWQEARGGAIGAQYTAPEFNNSYFVENIKEELDSPGEWFLDLDEGNLYLIPPGTGPGAAHVHPGSFELVPVHSPRVVSLLGNGSDAPLRHITLANLTIAHAAITFLEPYEVPSGGDWAVHRGAAVFVDGATEVDIVGNHFNQVDGNGVFLSRFVRNASVLRNAFTDVGDTAILVVGASGRHRTNQVDNTDYPAFNLVAENYVGIVGIWAKQSAAYFKSVTRANQLLNNVFHDGPRSGINFNDGAMGGEVMTGNLLLNYVKESNDHGPFNSWDRQPYVYSVDDDVNVLSISPQTHVISHNLIFNINFRGSSCGSIALDHDDESSQYDDNNNVLVFGGIKFYDGINRSSSENLIIHPWAGRAAGPPCFHALQADRNLSSHFSHFTANTCVIRAGDYPYYCDAGGAPFFNKTDRVDVRDNIFYRINATEAQAQDWGGACGCWPAHVPCTIKNLSDWQAFGNDVGSVVKTTLADADLIAMARAKLNWA